MNVPTRREFLDGLTVAGVMPMPPNGWLVRRARRFVLAGWPTEIFYRFYLPVEAGTRPGRTEIPDERSLERILRAEAANG